MRILIDGRLYGLENTGIGRYIEKLVENLSGIDRKNNYSLLLRKKYFEELNLPTNWKKVLVDIPHYTLREQIYLPRIIKLEQPEIVHFPHFNVPVTYDGKYVVTIHDLIKHVSRGSATTTHTPYFYWLKYLSYKFVFEKTVKRAATILVPSKTVKENLLKTYKLPEEKIIVTYEGVDIESQKSKVKSQNIGELFKKYGIEKPFVIYTGSVYPHKNIGRLIEAIKFLNEEKQHSLMLVVSCARGVFWKRLEEQIKELDANQFVRCAGFIPDEDLTILYRCAKAFVWPTLSEGFGLPGLEAMVSGLPVVCSDIPVLKEIYDEAAYYFDPFDTKSIALSIKKVTTDEALRAQLVKKGLQRAKIYSWKKMAVETQSVYLQF